MDLNRLDLLVRTHSAALLSRAASKLRPSNQEKTPNLTGDRLVEWSWILAHLRQGPGKVLDFGAGPVPLLSVVAARRGYEVTAIDRQMPIWPILMGNLASLSQDILAIPVDDAAYDIIINCSTIEHVGLLGRFGVQDDCPDGDMQAMSILHRALKIGGEMILTLPIGHDAIFAPLHRVYGKCRLPLLLKGFIVNQKEYWVKDIQNRWQVALEEEALNTVGSRGYYAIGCFTLVKGD